jgi:hypothetical protein
MTGRNKYSLFAGHCKGPRVRYLNAAVQPSEGNCDSDPPKARAIVLSAVHREKKKSLQIKSEFTQRECSCEQPEIAGADF